MRITRSYFLILFLIGVFSNVSFAQEYTVVFHLNDVDNDITLVKNMEIYVNGNKMQLPLLQNRTADYEFTVNYVPISFKVSFFGTGICATNPKETKIEYIGSYQGGWPSCKDGAVGGESTCYDAGVSTQYFKKPPDPKLVDDLNSIVCPDGSIALDNVEIVPDISIQVAPSTAGSTSPLWKTIPSTGTRTIYFEAEDVGGYGIKQVRYSLEDPPCKIENYNSTQTYRFSENPITFTITKPGPEISNVSTQKPSCASGSDGEISIGSINGPSTEYGFTLCQWNIVGTNGCTSSDQGYRVLTTVNGGTIGACEPTKCYNFQKYKSYPQWANEGIIIKSGELLDTIPPPIGNKIEISTGKEALQISQGIWELQIESVDTNDIYCPKIYYVKVDDPDSVQVDIGSATTDKICPGTADGQISIIGSSGNGSPYTYQVDGKGFNGVNVKPGLVSGNHTYQAKDKNGCLSKVGSFNIGTYNSISLNSINILSNSLYGGNDVSCVGASDAKISASANGGTGSIDYKFKLKNQTPDNFTDFSSGANIHENFGQGVYTIQAIDENSCYDTSSVTISDPPPFKASLSSTSPSSCYDASDGQINITLENYVGDLSYSMNGTNVSPSSTSGDNVTFNVKGDSTYSFDNIFYSINGKDCPVTTLPALQNINVAEPDELAFKRESFISPTCNGGSDGELEIVGLGGSGNYSYKLEGQPKSGDTVTYTNLFSGGPYSLEITDAGNTGCKKNGLFISLPARADTLHAQVETTIPLCQGESNGKIKVKGLNGDPPYTYALDTASTLTYSAPADSIIFTGLKGGQTYTIYIKDSKCEKVIDVYLNDATQVSATWDVNDVKCFGGSDGAIDLSPVGGTGIYTFTWTDESNVDIGIEEDIESLTAGIYKVIIEDTHSCSRSYDLTVNEPTELLVDTVKTTVETCTGRSDGSVEIEVSGGTMPYYYAVDEADSVASSLIQNLPNGSHVYTVTDQNGCKKSNSFNIDLTVVEIGSVTKEDLLCYEDLTGSIEFEGTGGPGPFTFSIDSGANYQTINLFESLSADRYLLMAKNNQGCESLADTLFLTQPEELLGQLDIIQEEACDQEDGMAEIVITGGTGEYIVEWLDDNEQLANPDQLQEGAYTVEVSDENNCTWSEAFTISNTPAPDLSYAVIDSSWCGQAIGSAEVFATGGFAPYQYQWNDDQSQQTATAIELSENVYEVTVTDSRNCESIISVDMQDGQPIYLASKIITPSGCAIPEGTIDITMDGGVGPYQYHWPDSVSTESVTYVDELFSGIYPVQVSDAVGCTLDLFLEVNSTDAPDIDTVITKASYCGLATGNLYAEASGGIGSLTARWLTTGEQYNGYEVDSVLAGTYLFEVVDSKGCKSYRQVEITDDLSVEPNLSLVKYDSSACDKALGRLEVEMTGGDAPYAYHWNDINATETAILNAIYAGEYAVEVTDAKGCVKSLSFDMVDAADPVLSFLGKTPSRCDSPTGTISVLAELGTESYQYYWDDPNNQDSETATDLGPGFYSVYALDENACSTDTFRIQVVNENSPIIKLATLEPVTCYGLANGMAEIEVTEGKQPYAITWNDPSNQNTLKAENLDKGRFTVNVTDDNGCQDNFEIEIQEPDSLIINQLNVQQPVCHGECDGALTVNALGGNYPYTYTLSDGNQGAAMSALCPGEYTLLIEDRKGCQIETAINLQSVSRIDLGLPELVEICEGGTYIADAGEWKGYEWSSESGTIGTSRKVEITENGDYFLHVETFKNCDVYDTLSFMTRDDLMEADFLVDSEIYAGDTVELVDISWPMPDQIEWIYPDSIHLIEEMEDRIYLIFPDSGAYEIAINASAGACSDYWSNTILVMEPPTEEEISSNGRLGYKEKEIKVFKLYPNPNSGNFTVMVELSEEAKIELELFEVQYGQTIRTYSGERSDVYEIDFNEQLANGIYYLKLEAMGKREVIKFMVVR